MNKFPKLIVFDLDYTLWPFYVELQFLKPYRLTDDHIIVDQRNCHVKHYPEVPMVLARLCAMNVDLALASRTSEIEGANQLVDLFGWRKYFKFIQIYPGSKVHHFKEFKKQSGYDYCEMLFFDDEERNIKEVSALKVTSVLVRDGMTMDDLDRGLNMFKKS